VSLDVLVRQLQGVVKQSLTLGSGWVNYSPFVVAGYEVASCSRFGRLVVLQGLVTKSGGTPTAGDVIATLPVGFRPTSDLVFAVATGSVDAFGRVDVQSDGDVVWRAGNTTETDHTSLSGIAFMVDAD
jgi:hypothetical protein